MKYEFVTVDVFTSVPFGGNPLAVLPHAEGLSGEQMQKVAREFNLSETAFVLPAETAEGTARVRIFTPAVELPFAGHPTVGTACVLATRGAVDLSAESAMVALEEGVGLVEVKVVLRGGKVESCQLTAAQAPEWGPPVPSRDVLGRLLGVEPGVIRADTIAPIAVSCGFPFLYVPLVDRAAVGRAALNRQRWEADLAGAWAENICLFAMDAEAEEVDVHMRMFGPGVGIDEDPATGAAATSLAALLGAASGEHDGRLRWRVEQGIEMGRPSLMDIEADLDAGEITAVRVGGATVPVSEGTIDVR